MATRSRNLTNVQGGFLDLHMCGMPGAAQDQNSASLDRQEVQGRRDTRNRRAPSGTGSRVANAGGPGRQQGQDADPPRGQGLDFLGCNIRCYPNRKLLIKLLIKPSQAAIRRVRERLASETRKLRGSNVQQRDGAARWSPGCRWLRS